MPAAKTEKKANKLVGIYCRISDDREGRGEGVERQEAACKELVKERGWTLVDTYVDNDISATQTRRPRLEYKRLMEDLSTGRINTVTVWAVDRLYRRPLELESLLELLDKRGDISVVAVQGQEMRLETSDGRAMARVMVALARRESDMLEVRIRAKHEELAAAGKPHGGRRTYGYNDDQLTVNEEEASVIRKMADLFLATNNTREVVRWLHKEGIRTRDGNEWQYQTVRTLLLNPRIAGFRSHRGTLTKAVWPAILDESTWLSIKARYANPDRRTSPSGKAKYLLTGLVTCGKCGHKMHAMTRGRKLETSLTYTCRNDPALLLRGCGGVRMLGKWADDWVTLLVQARLEEQPELIGELGSAPHSEYEERHTELLQEHTNTGAKLAELQDLWMEGSQTSEEYKRGRSTLTQKLAKLEKELLRLETAREAAPAGGLADFSSGWESRSIAERRALLQLLIERVVIKPSTAHGRNTFDRDRIEVEWK